jgi:enamine deaminase RidA (YjgF/YER057c/UK114 family)
MAGADSSSSPQTAEVKTMKARALQPSRFPWFDYSRYSFSLGLAAGSSLYLSGHSASEHDRERGAIVVKGGLAEQAGTAWTKIAAILEAGGCTLADIVRVVEYLTPNGIGAYSEAEGVRAETLGDRRPALNTVVVEQLLRPQALIEIEVVARQGEGELVADRTLPARETDGIVYLSSLLPVDARGSLIAPGDLVGQTEAIFERAARVLDAFELGLNDIVKTVDYLTPAALTDYKKTAEVRRECFRTDFSCGDRDYHAARCASRRPNPDRHRRLAPPTRDHQSRLEQLCQVNLQPGGSRR